MGSDGFWFSDKKRKEEEEAEEGPAVVVVVPHVFFFSIFLVKIVDGFWLMIRLLAEKTWESNIIK